MGHVEAGGHNAKFQGALELINYAEILQQMKEQYHPRLFEADGKTDQLRKELQSGGATSLQNGCKSLMSCLCLKKEEFDLCSEECKSETQCYQILQTTSKQHVQLAQNEMATDDIYVQDKSDYEDAVDI